MFNAPMVGELANAIKLKSIDVAVVWKPIAVAYQKEADYISIPENKNIVVPVSAGIIKTSSNKPDARKFLKFMTSKEGKAILEKHHYPTTDPRKH
jgi:ABC-type molybdate transport system substrate-binding protein